MYNHVYHIIHSTTAKKLVDRYKQQCQDFMASKTVKQFKASFPASATHSKLLAERFTVHHVWGSHTFDDLEVLVRLFGVGRNLKFPSLGNQLSN